MDRLPSSFWIDLGGKMREIGIEPHSVHGPSFPNLGTNFDAETKLLGKYIDITKALGAKVIVVHPLFDRMLHVCSTVHKALDWDRDLAFACSDALGDSGTMLAIENVPYNSFQYLEELFGKIDRTNVGMCFDTGHWQVRPERSLEAIMETFLPRLIHFHLDDNEGLCDAHKAPGQGNFDWETFLDQCGELPFFHELRMLELTGPILTQDPDAVAKCEVINREGTP